MKEDGWIQYIRGLLEQNTPLSLHQWRAGLQALEGLRRALETKAKRKP